MSFDINAKANIELTVKLGKLHRSALPVAIRGTLNNAAFETKKLIPKMASRKFTTRNKNFFRAFSSVQQARGFNINNMQAEVGIDSAKGSKVAEGLEKQETGGSITGRKLIPHDKGRVSGSHGKSVKTDNRFNKIKIQNIRKKGGKGNIDYLLIKKGGKGTVFKTKGSKGQKKLTPVYHYRNTKTTRVQASPFMKPASFIANKRMPSFFVSQAERQFKRLLK